MKKIRNIMLRGILFVVTLSIIFFFYDQVYAMEMDTDRPGMDYKEFDLSSADAKLCEDACTKDADCKAFTYVKPEMKKKNARCRLKKGIPPKKANTCCISGVKEKKVSQLTKQPPISSDAKQTPMDYKKIETDAVAKAARKTKQLTAEKASLLQRERQQEIKHLNADALARLQNLKTRKVTQTKGPSSLQSVQPIAVTPGIQLPANAAKIESLTPQPVTVGQQLAILGLNFGSKKRVTLNIEGLWISIPIVSWRDTHVVVTIPSALEENIGATVREGRIFVETAINTAAASVKIGPDTSRTKPEITSLSKTLLSPGEILFIDGKNFMSVGGKVYFNARSQGITLSGIIDHWDDTVVAVHLKDDLEGFHGDTKFYVNVENSLGARSNALAVVLKPNLEEEVYSETKCTWVAVMPDNMTFGDMHLKNGWHLKRSWLEVDAGGCHCDYAAGPPQTGTQHPATRISIAASLMSPCCCTHFIEIEGPKGLPSH